MHDPALNDLIGAIYDAVIDPSRWHSVINEIRQRYNFEIAMLSALKLTSGTPLIHVSTNVPADYERIAPSYNDDIIRMWGGPEGIAKLMVEEPILTTDVLRPADYENNRYYLEWCKPQGLEDQVVIQLSMDDTMVANLGLGRHVSKLPVTEKEMADLRILAPHLRRAVLISNLLDGAMGKVETFEAALSAMNSGAVIVDGNLRILHANVAARRMLESGDPIRDDEGRLELPAELVAGQLETAVSAADGPEVDLRRRGIGIPTRTKSGVPLVVHVMPLKRRHARSGLQLAAAAAVFISETAARAPMPIDAVSLLFELTPAEARIFELIAGGRTKRQIAEALSVAETTVKTHLANLYSKTDRHSRAELVRLAGELGVVA